jgi:putative MFS transporter
VSDSSFNQPRTPLPVRPEWGKILFRSPLAFYLGCSLATLGVLLHVPMLIQARSMHYQLTGMGLDGTMLVGMILIVVGLLVTLWAVSPPRRQIAPVGGIREQYRVRALDDAPLNRAHWLLVVVLGIALIVDIMKPATIAFVLPGMKSEYGLTSSTVAWLAFSALTGTTIGSFLWGWLADRVGRRAMLLFSAIMFVSTAICGTMPAFSLNVVMCFIMGVSAGGLLPVTIALLSEILPTRNRAALVVLLGGVGAVGGYLAASGGATLLEPTFGWRAMWLLNLPTGLLLILLNRYIPESPRFLLSQGRIQEANQIMKDFGVVAVKEDTTVARPSKPAASGLPGIGVLAKLPSVSQTVAIVLYGLAWGLVNYGFLLWLPTNLLASGFSVQASNAVLAKSALVAFPGVFLVAWLYVKWSSKNTLVLFSAITGLTLLAFIPLATGTHQRAFALTAAVVAVLIGSTAMTTTLQPYGAEVYPTWFRATGSGIAAGSGKAGGVLGIGAVLAHLAPTLIVSAVVVSIPVALGTIAIAVKGIETRGHRLDEPTVLTPEAAGVS